jgi:hypothetical protein
MRELATRLTALGAVRKKVDTDYSRPQKKTPSQRLGVIGKLGGLDYSPTLNESDSCLLIVVVGHAIKVFW